MIMDSVKIKSMIDQGVAPNAFLMPISLVLSLTDMSIMLLIPTIPAMIVPIPMIHWPDSMVTYSPNDKLLLPNDAFGQHIASS